MNGQIGLFDYFTSFLPERIDITDHIPVGHHNAIRREYLSAVTGLSDRKMRIAIHKARRDHVILNLSNGNGSCRQKTTHPLCKAGGKPAEKYRMGVKSGEKAA